MDLRKLKKLIDLVQESGISELEVTEGEDITIAVITHGDLTALLYLQGYRRSDFVERNDP